MVFSCLNFLLKVKIKIFVSELSCYLPLPSKNTKQTKKMTSLSTYVTAPSHVHSTVEHAHVKEMAALIYEHHACLIDVRGQKDRDSDGKIPHAVNIPLDELATALTLGEVDFKAKYGFKKPNKDTPIVTHCWAGQRAHTAQDMFAAAGYTHVKAYVDLTRIGSRRKMRLMRRQRRRQQRLLPTSHPSHRLRRSRMPMATGRHTSTTAPTRTSTAHSITCTPPAITFTTRERMSITRVIMSTPLAITCTVPRPLDTSRFLRTRTPLTPRLVTTPNTTPLLFRTRPRPASTLTRKPLPPPSRTNKDPLRQPQLRTQQLRLTTTKPPPPRRTNKHLLSRRKRNNKN